ncbi:MAG: hypothetical protein ACHQHN_11510 [Sphingobacteriales bacterium]
MKYLLFLIGLLVSCAAHAQSNNTKLIGKYQDYFGNEIVINSDSTFRYAWHFDLFSSWSNGKWSIKNDTIYFRTILVYDTVSYTNANGKIADRFIIANNEIPKRVYPSITDNSFLSWGQNHKPCPDKLFYKDDKLYGIKKSGKLIRKKVRTFWDNKKSYPMYFKQDKTDS